MKNSSSDMIEIRMFICSCDKNEIRVS